MSSILYIGKDYCRSLEQLQQYFRKVTTAEDPLYQELLTLQRDGLIAQWLEEGDEKEKTLAKKIRGLLPSLTNRDLMEKLGELMTNQNAGYVVNLLSYVELKEVAYALTESSFVELKYAKLANGGTINIEERYQRTPLHLKLTFKVIKPEKEIFRLKAILSMHGKKIDETTSELQLDNESMRKEIVAKFNVPMTQVRKDVEAPYVLEIRDESQVLLSAKICTEGSVLLTANGVKFKMIKVKGGKFEMGEGSDAHDVTLDSYYIGEMTVTNELWNAVMTTQKRNGETQLPVVNVSWYDCDEFVKKLNKITKKKFRLPTEAEWEFAARGGVKSKGYVYSGSNNLTEVAWYDENSRSRIHPVKQKKANELGIYDMSGNVWEWCQDWHAKYKKEPQTNPMGPARGSLRVVRGGTWGYSSVLCRSSYRNCYKPGNTNCPIGFRLALS